VDALRAGLPGVRQGRQPRRGGGQGESRGPDVLWADLNTASPGTKRQLADIAGQAGVAFADVAIMAPVPGRGLRVPMLASGAGAARYAVTLARISDGTRRHAVRRITEMQAAADMLAELGVPPLMADASRALHARLTADGDP